MTSSTLRDAHAEYLKHKSWYLEYSISNKELLETDSLIKTAADMPEDKTV